MGMVNRSKEHGLLRLVKHHTSTGLFYAPFEVVLFDREIYFWQPNPSFIVIKKDIHMFAMKYIASYQLMDQTMWRLPDECLLWE